MDDNVSNPLKLLVLIEIKTMTFIVQSSSFPSVDPGPTTT